MANILTDAEAADWVRTDATDTAMLNLLDSVDATVKAATGRDWTADATVHPLAKAAAGMILTAWYDDPAQIGSVPSRATGALLMLEVEALKYRKYTFFGVNGAGPVYLPGALEGDDVISLTGVHGVSGDQSAKFEAEISDSNYIQQTDNGDLSENIYVAILKSPSEDVTA